MIHRFIDLFPVGFLYVPYVGTYFDSGTGFNFNYVGVLTTTIGQDPTPISTPVSTATGSFAQNPVLAPDNSLIAWVQSDIRTIAPDGTGEQSIYNSGLPNWLGSVPNFVQWSPDSTKLIFGLVGGTSIYTIPAGGGAITTVYTDPSARETQYPIYNHDGTRIAFNVRLSASSHGIWVMDADGTNATQLTSSSAGWIQTWDVPVYTTWMYGLNRLTWNAGTNLAAGAVWKVMNDDGTNIVTLDSGNTRYSVPYRGWLPDDSGYIVPRQTGAQVDKVAVGGTGATALFTPSVTYNQGTFIFANRVYFESGNDIYSALLDGTDERNESASTTDNLGLTG